MCRFTTLCLLLALADRGRSTIIELIIEKMQAKCGLILVLAFSAMPAYRWLVADEKSTISQIQGCRVSFKLKNDARQFSDAASICIFEDGNHDKLYVSFAGLWIDGGMTILVNDKKRIDVHIPYVTGNGILIDLGDVISPKDIDNGNGSYGTKTKIEVIDARGTTK